MSTDEKTKIGDLVSFNHAPSRVYTIKNFKRDGPNRIMVELAEFEGSLFASHLFVKVPKK